MSIQIPEVAPDVELPAVVLDEVNRKLKNTSRTGVASRVVDAQIDRSMTQASTLTLMLEDPDRELIRSGLFRSTIDLRLDGLWWRLVQVQKQVDQLQLTFEDRVVSLLREVKGPRKAPRSQMTRAEFALSIVRSVKYGPPIPFVSPQLDTRQPVQSQPQAQAQANARSTTKHGISPDANLTVKGAPATKAQKALGSRVLDAAAAQKAGQLATLALIEACIVESTMHNSSIAEQADGAKSRGVLQVTEATAKGLGISQTDVDACVRVFLTRGFAGYGGAIALAAKNPNWSAGTVAWHVEMPAKQYRGRYDQYQAEAMKWVAAYQGPGPTVTPTDPTTGKRKQFQFTMGGTAGKKETGWDAIVRLAKEVDWRCFASENAIYFESDDTLLTQMPIAILSEFVPNVDNIDFEVDQGKVHSDATVTARTTRYDFAPGSIVELQDCGPADGRWIVSDVQRGLFDPAATITLTRPMRPYLEPYSADSSTPQPRPGPPPGSPGSAPGSQPSYSTKLGWVNDKRVADAIAYALRMDAKNWPYVWGGGHKVCGKADNPHERSPAGHLYTGLGFDCSGSTGAVLGGGDGELGFKLGKSSVPGSGKGGFESWGNAGKGRELTIYANADHVFVVFKTSSGVHVFSTSSANKGGGPGFVSAAGWPYNVRAQFAARHWPGT